jgi:hypothetical protein
MTDPTRVRKTKERAPTSSDSSNEFWRMMESWFSERTKDMMPTMGTVVGKDGGGVKVKLDDEGIDRQVGFPRSRGIDYQNGMRVLTGMTKSGERVILGGVDSGNNEQAVGANQLFDKSVDSRHVANDAIDTGHVKDRAINSSKLDSDVSKKIDAAATKTDLDKKADKSDIPDTKDFAKAGDLNDLKARVDKLEKKVNKSKGA